MSNSEARARALLAALPDLPIVCIGDVMLDRFVYGDVERISGEAPIPVLRARREDAMPGGAGNVARNLRALGARTTLIGVTGDDAEGASLHALLEAARIHLQLIVMPGRKTTRKWRFIGGNQQLLRADWEDTDEPSDHCVEQIVAAIQTGLAGAAAVVLSDYGKGMLTGPVLQVAIQAARARGIPVLVDPKGTDYSIYAGATVVTPNKQELSEAAGGMPTELDDEVAAAAAHVSKLAGVEAILATRGPHGMAIVCPGEPPVFRRSVAREVFDVSGAGDTVVAVLAAGLAFGETLVSSAELANVAAGVVVSKLGTATVEPEELIAGCRSTSQSESSQKLRSCEQAAISAARWRREGLTVGFTNGCFDLLHPGHIHLLEQARAQCDRLVVAINSDASVARLKGDGRPRLRLDRAGDRVGLVGLRRYRHGI